MLDNCPCKLSVEDILKSRQGELQENRSLKLTTGRGILKVLRINYVWVQGRIESVFEKSDKVSFLLKDETGTIRATYVGNTEIPWLSKGIYCSAVGKITQNDIAPEVEAVKVTNLSHNPVFERMWPLEVKELKLLYLGLSEPKLSVCEIDSP